MPNFSDLEVDFQTYVAPDYEFRERIKSERDLTIEQQLAALTGYRPSGRSVSHGRELVPLGKPKLVRPKRKALDLAVGLLLRTPVPGRNEEVKNSDELAHLERNVLAVAKHIGPLNARHDAYAKYHGNESEPLRFWLYLAQTIQLMFEGRRPGTIYPVGTMTINLACKSDGSSFMTVRPRTTLDALIYHAAQMIAKGTISQTCEQCGTAFLSGGAASGKDKKRGDARFCSDECRWKFHNESRRRAREGGSKQ
jgi:hypothetical protein